MSAPRLPPRLPRPLRSAARPAAVFPARRDAALLAALLLAACGYPDAALTPPEQAAAPARAAERSEDLDLGTPVAVIRFGREPPDYEAALAQAVAEARAKRPDARFHLLAVTAGRGPQLARAPSLSHAETVLRSLAALGVPPDEVSLAAVAAPAGTVDEVRLYLR